MDIPYCMSIVHGSLLHFVQDPILSKNRTRRKVHRSLLHFVQALTLAVTRILIKSPGAITFVTKLVSSIKDSTKILIWSDRSNRTSEHTYHQLLRTNTKQQNLHSTVSSVVPFDRTCTLHTVAYRSIRTGEFIS